MSAIGLLSDSDGNLQRLDEALKLLASLGARRFMFAGGRYADVDEWIRWKREEARAANDYTNLDFLQDVTTYLIGLEQVDRPAAFGTAHEMARHAEELARMRSRILRTPERGSLQYQDSAVPKKSVDMVGDALFCLVHDKNDLDKEDMINSLVLVHGKEAEPKVVQIGPRYFVTPGRLSGDKPSVALVKIAEKAISFTGYALNGTQLGEPQTITGGAKTKVSVK